MMTQANEMQGRGLNTTSEILPITIRLAEHAHCNVRRDLKTVLSKTLQTRGDTYNKNMVLWADFGSPFKTNTFAEYYTSG